MRSSTSNMVGPDGGVAGRTSTVTPPGGNATFLSSRTGMPSGSNVPFTVMLISTILPRGEGGLPPLLFLLALLGALAGALAVPGVALRLEHPFLAGVERPHLTQPGHHLDPLPDTHRHHLLHQGPDRVELL